MLKSLLIHNIVLIDKLEVKIWPGLCVLTGETGSGKSILFDALALAVGQRSSSRLLRNGAKQAMVLAEFEIPPNFGCLEILEKNGLIDPENNQRVVLKRLLFENSTSKALVNDIPVTVNLLAQLGDSLLEIHGQHDQRGLLNPSYHQFILDEYAKATELLKQVNQAFEKWQETEKQLRDFKANQEARQREKDYLEHSIKELEKAAIVVGEEQALLDQRYFLNNREKALNLIKEIELAVNDSDSRIISAQKLLLRNQNLGELLGADLHNQLIKLTEVLEQLIIKNEEAGKLVTVIFESLGLGSLTLEEVEERLFLIRSLSRKFNTASDALPALLEELRIKLRKVETIEDDARELLSQKASFLKDYMLKAEQLSKIRGEAASNLVVSVEKELSQLKMASVRFQVKITKLEQPAYNGLETIKFTASTNPNSPADDISKIASGGELSRFMLALKVALSEVKSVPILVFDEIDTGIGGSVASAVGERLKLLANKLQVLVVTHHAQVAAKASQHLRVSKSMKEEEVSVRVETLDRIEQEYEIARMLSGEKISEEALAAGRNLIKESNL